MNQGEHLQKGRCFSFIFERVCALVRGAEAGRGVSPPPKKNIAKPYKRV